MSTKKPPDLEFLKASAPAPITCPMCKAADFDAQTLQFELRRTCRKCGNVWSGGSAAVALVDPPAIVQPKPVIQSQPAPLAENDPDLDLPEFYGAPYRRFGGEE